MLTLEGQIINHDTTSRGRVEIGDDGMIWKVSKPTGKADVVLDHELIFPGFIDLHVHARECADHSQDYKEDFTTASEAAVNGGVVAFADMPNNPTPPVDDASYDEKYLLAKKAEVDVVLYAGVGLKTHPLSKKAPYKLYMAKSVGDLSFDSFDDLDEALAAYRGQNISFHCEDPEILRKHQGKSLYALKRPAKAEVSAVEFALRMIEKYELKGKICHISTAESFLKITAVKKRNGSVTMEVAPHHLYFDQSVKDSLCQPVAKRIFDTGACSLVNPPLRAKEDRLALIEGLRSGDIDYLATDHAPHTFAEKEQGAAGLPHLDTFGPFVSWLIDQHRFSPQTIARVCAFNPGRFLNQFVDIKYGQIKEGFTGSLTVIDMHKPITINKSMLKTKCGWSPFEGVTFPGSVKMTVTKGKILKS